MKPSVIGRQKKGTSVLFLLVIVTMFFCSCATAPISLNKNPLPSKTLDSKYNILVLKPFLRFERIQDESTLPDSLYAGDAIETRLTTDAITEVESRHFIPIDTRSHKNDKLSVLFNRLQFISPQLTLGETNKQTLDIFRQLDSLMKYPVVLVQYLKVKVGTGGSWNPNTGAITSSNSSSYFQASLMSCKTGKVLWRNQVLLRDTPQIDDSNFKESVELLYQTFPNRKEQ